MNLSRRKVTMFALSIGSIIGAVTFVRVFILGGLWQIFAAVFYTGENVGSFHISLLALNHYIRAARLGFYISIGLILLNPVQRLFGLVRQYTYPPYYGKEVERQVLPISQTEFKHSERYSWKLSISMLFIPFAYIYVLIETGYIQAPLYAGSVVQGLDSGLITYFGVIVSYVTSVPVGPIAEEATRGIEQDSVMIYLLFYWMPAIFLSIGFLNLIDLLYNIFKRYLYSSIVLRLQ